MVYDVFFRKHPIFTSRELAEYLLSHRKAGPRTQESILSYYRKTGRIINIRNGLYAVIPPGADPKMYEIDPFLITSKLAPDAVLSYHTALEFYGRAYSVQEAFTCSCFRPRCPFVFRSRTFRGVTFPKALCRTRRD